MIKIKEKFKARIRKKTKISYAITIPKHFFDREVLSVGERYMFFFPGGSFEGLIWSDAFSKAITIPIRYIRKKILIPRETYGFEVEYSERERERERTERENPKLSLKNKEW